MGQGIARFSFVTKESHQTPSLEIHNCVKDIDADCKTSHRAIEEGLNDAKEHTSNSESSEQASLKCKEIDLAKMEPKEAQFARDKLSAQALSKEAQKDLVTKDGLNEKNGDKTNFKPII